MAELLLRVVTDYSPLAKLTIENRLPSRMVRISYKQTEYNENIENKTGKENTEEDALFRNLEQYVEYVEKGKILCFIIIDVEFKGKVNYAAKG